MEERTDEKPDEKTIKQREEKNNEMRNMINERGQLPCQIVNPLSIVPYWVFCSHKVLLLSVLQLIILVLYQQLQ